MLGREVLMSWLVILNVTWLVLFLFSWYRLPKSPQRITFLAFLIPYSVWANCLFIIQLIGANESVSRLVSQSIFASGAAYHVLLGSLLISIANSQKLQSPICRLLALNTVVVCVLSYFGFWENGVEFNAQTGLAPIPGPFLWYFNVSLLLWAVYYFYQIIQAYRSMTRRDLLKCQLHILIMPAVLSMGMSLTTNVIIPGITGNYSLTAIAGFWLFMFFAAVAYIIKMGEKILLFQSIRDFEARLPASSWNSIEYVGQLIRSTIVRSQSISDLPSRHLPLSLTNGHST